MGKKSAPVLLPRFGPAIEFPLTVPAGYRHANALDGFRASVAKKETVFCFDDRMSDECFPNASHELMPGRTYRVMIYPIIRASSTEECMEFLRAQDVLFVGPRGLTLLYQLESRRITRGRHVVSFDEEDMLFSDERMHTKVPVLSNDNQVFLFDLVHQGAVWTPVHSLLCFAAA